MLNWRRKPNRKAGQGDQTTSGQLASSQATPNDQSASSRSQSPLDLAADRSHLGGRMPNGLLSQPYQQESMAHAQLSPESGLHLAAEDDIDFDEEWYLAQNADVARAVAEGRGKSGLEHYLRRGRFEGRQPLPPYGWKRPEKRELGTADEAP